MTTIRYGDRVQFNMDYGPGIPKGTLATAWALTEISGAKIASVTFDDRSMPSREVFVDALDFVERCGAENSDCPGEFASGREPQTGEQYLDRAVEWLSDSSDDTYDMFVEDVLAVAQFLRSVAETNKQ